MRPITLHLYFNKEPPKSTYIGSFLDYVLKCFFDLRVPCLPRNPINTCKPSDSPALLLWGFGYGVLGDGGVGVRIWISAARFPVPTVHDLEVLSTARLAYQLQPTSFTKVL